MKKIFRSLITIALCAPLLGGCAFLDWLEDDGTSKNQTAEKTKLIGLELSDYTDEVEKGTTYTYDGKITAKYEGGATAELKNEDVTFSTLSTATANVTKTLKVSYTDKYKENGAEKEVTEKAEAKIKVISTLQSISASALSVGIGRTRSLNVKFEPSDATHKDLEYSSNNESVATVSSDGKVSGHADGTAKITVTSKTYPDISTEVNVSVSESVLDAWTILMYVCGANLESGTYYDEWSGQYVTPSASEASGLASADIDEILGVNGQPDDVNIVIQTGGANVWQSGHSYSINKSKLQRWEVDNKTLVNKQTLETYESMGKADTLQSFIEWGIENYEADNMGLIFWDHGGGMDGCCYDEKKNDDSLTNDEVVTAVSGAFSNKGIDKFEFVGYDCCLMQMMEIAEFNSPYFNYQVTSQELENGTGWAYNQWVDDLYAGESTETILTAIVDGFIAVNGGKNGHGGYYEGEYYPADQTLSVVNLNKISAFKTAWENMASATKSKIGSSKSTFKSQVVNQTKHFADLSGSYKSYAEFDCYDFLLKLENSSTFNPGGTYVQDAKDAFDDMILYNLAQVEGSADAYGLSCYIGTSYNDAQYTHFTNWRSLVSYIGGC